MMAEVVTVVLFELVVLPGVGRQNPRQMELVLVPP
jgi:hypothetical protein